MLKRILLLVVTSSLISAGLLYLGITLMTHASPAYASSMKALVAEKVLGEITFSSAEGSLSSAGSSDSSNTDRSGSTSSEFSGSSQALTFSRSDTPSLTPITGVTIAGLLKETENFEHLLVTISGVATVLNDEKFLLNDGTGQILVEIEDDDQFSLAVIHNLSVTVTGEFDDDGDESISELKACSITYQGQTVTFDCLDDDDDDMDDDDMDDDDMDDDDMDDDADDDADDDDSSGSGSDDSDDMDDDSSGSGEGGSDSVDDDD